jgi:hypothetical protein
MRGRFNYRRTAEETQENFVGTAELDFSSL